MFGKNKKTDEENISEKDDAEETISAMLQKIHTDAAKVNPSENLTSVIKECFDQNEWKYDYDSKKERFYINFKGKNMNLRIIMASVDGDLISFTESDISVSPKRYSKVLQKINELNKANRYGSFFLDEEGRRIILRCNQAFPEKSPSIDYINSFVDMVIKTFDESGLREVVEVQSDKKEDNPMFS